MQCKFIKFKIVFTHFILTDLVPRRCKPINIFRFAIIINFIGLPLILKKRKRMKRVVAKRAANNPANLDDEFQDFFN